MAEIKKLIDAYEKVKGELFTIYIADIEKGQTSNDEFALTMAKSEYQNLFRSAIDQLKKYGSITDNLRREFGYKLQYVPSDDLEIGDGRAKEYYDRFLKVAPLLASTPITNITPS